MADARNPAGHAGLGGSFSAYSAAILAYLHARMELVGVEAKEAGVHYVKLLLLVVGAAVLFLFGYLLVLVAVAFALAYLLSISWMWTAGALGLLHFIAGVLLLLLAKNALGRKVFSYTLTELKKDRTWITQRTSTN